MCSSSVMAGTSRSRPADGDRCSRRSVSSPRSCEGLCGHTIRSDDRYPEPGVAERWEVCEEGTGLDFHLREGRPLEQWGIP